MNIKNTTNLVKSLLEDDERARNDDDYLYWRVAEETAKGKIIPVSTLPLRHFLLNRKFFGVPAFESVRRARQKVQAKCPDLAASEEVRAKRKKREKEMREYARGE